MDGIIENEWNNETSHTPNSTGIDWSLVRLQYEVFNEDEEVLAAENGTTVNIIRYAARSEGWKRMPLAEATRNWTDIEHLDDFSEDLTLSLQQRMSTLALIKRNALNPRYVALETAILTKAMELVKSLEVGQLSSATQLKSIAEVLERLKGSNGMTVSGKSADGDGSTSNKTMIVIKNEYGGGAGVNNAEEITTVTVSDAPGHLLSAGETGVMD